MWGLLGPPLPLTACKGNRGSTGQAEQLVCDLRTGFLYRRSQLGARPDCPCTYLHFLCLDIAFIKYSLPGVANQSRFFLVLIQFLLRRDSQIPRQCGFSCLRQKLAETHPKPTAFQAQQTCNNTSRKPPPQSIMDRQLRAFQTLTMCEPGH